MAEKYYKYKPFTPTTLKMAKIVSPTEDLNIAGLQKQKDNLEKRLAAQGITKDDPGILDNRNFLEKALNLRQDQGVLMDFFEVISRPTEAVKAGILAGYKGESVIEGAWEGLSGNVGERGYMAGSDFLEELGIDTPDSGVGKFVTDVAVDIALDPLTYLPAGFFSKRIGKLFKRSKDILNTTLTGEVFQVAAKYGLVDDAGRAFTKIDDLNAALAKMEPEKIKNIQNQLDKAAMNASSADVMFRGTLEDFSEATYRASSSYEQTVTGYRKRAEWLKNTRDELVSLREKLTAQAITQDEYAEQVAKLLPDKFKGEIMPNVLSELKLLDEIDVAIKQLGDEYVAVMTSTASKADDVSILKRLVVGEKEYFVKVMSVDSKVAAGAYGATATVKFARNDAGELVASFAKGDGAFNFASVEEDLFKFFKDENYKVMFEGEEKTLYEVLEKVGAGGRRPKITGKMKLIDEAKAFNKNGTLKAAVRKKLTTAGFDLTKIDAADYKKIIQQFNSSAGVRNSFNPYKLLEETYGTDAQKYIDGKKALDDIMKGMNRAKHQGGEGYIYLATGGNKGKGIFVKFKDVENYLDYSAMSFTWTRSGTAKVDQFRLMGNFGMSDDAIERVLKEVPIAKRPTMAQILASNMTETTRTIEVSLLDYLQDRGDFIGKAATVLNQKVVKPLKNMFDPYAFLTKEQQNIIRNMRGELAVEFQQKAYRLAGLEESFRKAFPDLSPRAISEIVQAGAYLENGIIRYAPRTMDAAEYVRHMLQTVGENAPFQLRQFSDLATEKTFVDTMNELMDATNGVDDLFYITEKNGIKALGFKGTEDDLRQLLNYVDFDLHRTTLNFGKLNLGEDAERVLREWEDLGEAISLKTDIQKLLVQEGGFTNFAFAGKVDDTYLRHTLTKEAYDYISKNSPGVLSKFAKPGGEFFRPRQFLGTIDEANDFLRAYHNIDLDVFDPNFFRSTEDFLTKAFRNVEQGKMIDILLTTRDKYGMPLMQVVDNTRSIRASLGPDDIMVKNFNEAFPAMYKNLSPEGQKALDAFLESQSIGPNSALVLNRSFHGVMKQVEKAFVELPSWVKAYDKFLNTWKGLTLITPGFHMRNLFGNSFNSYSVGMGLADQLKYTRIAALELNQFADFQKMMARGEELTKAQRKIYDRVSRFRSSGLIQSHQGVRDLEQVKEMTERALKEGRGAVGTAYNKAVRFNFNIAEKMDDTQRYILYRWGLDKYGDAQKAIDIVGESLFDYSRLTGFEKDVLKRIFPFYTFMKNNFIFQAKNIFRNPRQYARLGRAYNYYLEDIAGYSPEELPDYVTENLWIPLPMMVTKNDKEGIAFLKATLPLADFTELVENPFRKGVASITTPIKLAIELGAGRDMFTGAPLEQFPGQTSRMEAGTGVLAGLRDERGNFALASTPIAQKIMNDLGLRTPSNVLGVGLDILDTIAGYQGTQEGMTDFLQRAGVTGTQELSNIELTRLYQDLEYLRELKKLYEQETGNQLPALP